MKPLSTGRDGRARTIAAGSVLVVLVAAAYVPAFDAGFIWDDDDYVTRNLTLRSMDGLRRIWLEPGAVPQYYPLVHSSFWVEYHLWGQQPRGYHAVNILLHAVNALLLWLVLRRLAVPGAWLAAAVFAVHPVHVESVAWITERKNVLSGFFYLAALLAYLHFRGIETSAPADRRTRPKRQSPRQFPLGRTSYGLALALFACALLSKTVTCSLPVVILLLLWWKRGRLDRQEFVDLIPFFVLAAALGSVTIWMEMHRVGAFGPDWAFSIVDRCLIAGRAVWFYAAKLAWPVRLTFIYPRWAIDSRVWWQYGFPLAAIAFVGGLYVMRTRLGRGPLVAVLCFIVTLFPALGFVNVFPMRYTFVADHYQYLASVGLIVVSVSACSGLWPRWMPSGATAAAAGVLLLVLAGLTRRQAGVYRDIETLWRDTLVKSPRCWMAHDNLGLHLQQLGDLDTAMAHYDTALAIKPDNAHAHNNLATALAARGRIQEGIEHLEAALRIEPDYPEAQSNLGNALATIGQFDAAIERYQAALRLRPAYADAHSNLANVLAAQGRSVEAISHYEEALRIDPDFTDAHANLAALLVAQGRIADAKSHLVKAVRLRPGDAELQRRLEQVRDHWDAPDARTRPH